MRSLATPAAARTGWTRTQTVKNAALAAGAHALIAALAPWPAAALRVLGRALGRAAYALVPHLRRVALANLAIAFPDRDAAARRAIARRAFRTLGAHLGDSVAVLGGCAPSLPDAARAAATLAAAGAGGRGVVLASAHLGPWEAVAAALVASGVPLVAVVRESYDPRLTPLQDRLRRARGVPVVSRGAPGAAAGMLRVLRRGGVLGIPMDLRSRVPSIDSPFLGGRLAPTPVGPARLALRTGAAVVVGTIDPEGHVTATRIPTSDLSATPQDEAALTARINAELAARIVAHPEGWPWMHERGLGAGS